MLDVEDMVMVKIPDSRSIMTFLVTSTSTSQSMDTITPPPPNWHLCLELILFFIIACMCCTKYAHVLLLRGGMTSACRRKRFRHTFLRSKFEICVLKTRGWHADVVPPLAITRLGWFWIIIILNCCMFEQKIKEITVQIYGNKSVIA